MGLLNHPAYLPDVEAYITWYLAHLNPVDRYGLQGTIYDYEVKPDGTEVSTGDYDSADSYAATFITLLRAYVENGGNKEFLKGRERQIARVGEDMIRLIDSDGLTIAKPDYPVKYLMDNCEVYQGLNDMAALYETVFQKAQQAARFHAYAETNKNAILRELSNQDEFFVYKSGTSKKTANWHTWYADSSSQLFPIAFGILDPKSERAQHVYEKLNAHFPEWSVMKTGDPFPWAMIGYTAALMGDRDRARTYSEKVKSVYVDQGHPWAWYSAESGWYLHLHNQMNASLLQETPR